MSREEERLSPADKAYTVSEVAEILNVTTYTIHNWINKNILRAFKAGSKWRILPTDLQEFIESKRNDAEAEA